MKAEFLIRKNLHDEFNDFFEFHSLASHVEEATAITKPTSSSLTSKIHVAEGQLRDVTGLISVSMRFGSRLEFQILKLFNSIFVISHRSFIVRFV